MNSNTITQIAKNILVGFLLSLGIIPSEGEDTLEIRDYGPHRVFTQQAIVPPETANAINGVNVLANLEVYIDHHNALPTAIRFFPYSVYAYTCPCGCGTYLCVSIYHDA